MNKIYKAAVFYATIGLAAGIFSREYTKYQDFSGYSELAVVHTHALALGFLVMLIVLGLEKSFQLSKTKSFNLFYWHYNGGLLLTLAMMVIIGIGQVGGTTEPSAALAGIAGLGHIIITAGVIFLLVAIGKRIKA